MIAFAARTRAASALSVLVVASATGCGSGSHAAQPPACKQLPAADLPHAAGQVTETDTGVFCLGRNEQVDAFLTAPAAGSKNWADIAASDSGVLGQGNKSVVTAPLGVTFGAFVGRNPGTAVLNSTLPDGTTWSVTIVVR